MKKGVMPEVPSSPEQTSHTMLYIECSTVFMFDNGVIGVEVPSISMKAEERGLLEKLFPHTMEHAYKLLDKESLLGAIAECPHTPSIRSFPTR